MIKKENHMVKAGQAAGQKRDDPVVTVPWTPRADDGRRAILTSERSAVFERPMPAPSDDDPGDVVDEAAPFEPMPEHWTSDLVHCRLVSVYWLCANLPRIQWPAQYRSVLEQLQPATEAAPGRRRVLSSEDMDRIDWTLACVCRHREDDQLILRGFMAGLSLRDIAEELQRLRAHGIGLGKGVGKNAVGRRYRTLLANLAEQWIATGEPIDTDTRRVWSTKLEKNL